MRRGERIADIVVACVMVAVALGCSDDDETGPSPGVDAGADAAGGGGTGGTGGSGGTAGSGGTDAGADAADAAPDAIDGGGRMPLDPLTIPKYEHPLVIPPAMPPVSTGAVTEYAIAVRQFEQQVLPPGYPATTVWGYGRDGDPLPGSGAPSTFHFPAFTIEATRGQPSRVKWVNALVDEAGHHLPHLLPVDQTLDWANPEGPVEENGSDPTPYTGPVPIVTHVHGGNVESVSDGNPRAWYLPNASDIPTAYAREGSRYGSVVPTDPGAAVFEYPNDQRASTIWYHDHAFGVTRLNVYAGLAGFYLVRDTEEAALDLPGPAPAVGDAAGTDYYEIPLAIQDRAFYDDGSLRYPTSRSEFDGYEGPYAPDSDVHPIWNPEVFGDTMVVNGRVWPFLDVEARLYRFRIVNGNNARFLRLRLDAPGLSFVQIGTDGGLLSGAPATTDELPLGPGERADVIVDFSAMTPGDDVLLLNLGPDEPFKGPSVVLPPANPATTGQIMQFRVVAPTGQGRPGQIPTTLPAIDPLATALAPRDVTLNEVMSATADIPRAAKLGTALDGPLDFDGAITETPSVGDTEIWRVINLTEDAHPIHLHLVMFQVLDRIPLDAGGYAQAQEAYLASGGTPPRPEDFFSGSPEPPAAGENGWKDTFIANPGEVTRIIASFDRTGLYVWHCHLLEHEDNEMMRPFEVLPLP